MIYSTHEIFSDERNMKYICALLIVSIVHIVSDWKREWGGGLKQEKELSEF